jgi:hypothetical protein
MPFEDPVVAGSVLVRPAIRSPNYVAGVSGWTINIDGSAEFSDVVMRGEVYVGPSSDGSYVRIWNQDPGSGAVIELRPGNSVGTVDAPAYLATGDDPVFGAGGVVLSGPSINGSGIPSLSLSEEGAFLEGSQGVIWLTADNGITLQPGVDVDFLDASNAVRTQFQAGSGYLRNDLLQADYADLNSGAIPGGALTAVCVYDGYFGPSGGSTTTSATFVNLPGSTGKTVSKGYGGTELELEIWAGVRANAIGTQVELAVQLDNGAGGLTDYTIGRFYFDVANKHEQVGGILSTGVIAAGTYTARARWRRMGGAGTLTIDDFDRVSVRVREVRG